MDEDHDVKTKLPKVAKVKNKMPAPVQITAEQLLREAKERELELVQPPPKQKISDEAELRDYRMRKRKAFEDQIRKNRTVICNWLKYAGWEESQLELQRARSVYERTLDIDHRNITVWLKYAEMEMRHRQINHARNVWDRAVTILPRANQFWYKYTYMEEMLGNIAGARQVFERWMEWEPEEQAWHSYINFELRYKELDRARVIYEKFVIVHPEIKNWLKYAKFEEKNQFISSARRIYERAVEYFGDEHIDETLLISFAKFEETQREHDRARVIYKYALDHLPKEKCQEVYKQYTIHEKKFGDRTAIEDVIVSKRKFKYEEEVKLNPFNYDAWFDYLKLMESDGKVDDVREIYERAIANVPPSQEKRHWRRYIYLWINYAIYEELEAQDIDRARQVYQACVEIIPHKRFTFAKVWLLFAYFEVRQKSLMMARKILGTSIGKCPKDKLFRGYIELELQLREFDRCRKLYEKFLEFSPENCTTWMKFAEMEAILGDIDRARAVFELAIAQPKLDMPEVLWKSYIDFEMEQEEFERTRGLYQRLLQRTKHVKVWLSFAQFELSVGGSHFVQKARGTYRQANDVLKESEEKEERLMLLEAWKEFEQEYGDDQSLASVNKLMPKKVKRRRKIQTDTGADAGWEEYYDYIFPDDESSQPNLKLLAMAKMWKEQVKATSNVDESHADSDEDANRNSPHDERNVARGSHRDLNIMTSNGERDEDEEGDDDDQESTSSESSSDSEDGVHESGDNNKDAAASMQSADTSDVLVEKDHIKVENDDAAVDSMNPDLDRDDSISSTSSSESSDSEEEEDNKADMQQHRKRPEMMRPQSSESDSDGSPRKTEPPLATVAQNTRRRSSSSDSSRSASPPRSKLSRPESPPHQPQVTRNQRKRSASSSSDSGHSLSPPRSKISRPSSVRMPECTSKSSKHSGSRRSSESLSPDISRRDKRRAEDTSRSMTGHHRRSSPDMRPTHRSSRRSPSPPRRRRSPAGERSRLSRSRDHRK